MDAFDPFADMPPRERRLLNRALKLRAWAEIVEEAEGDEFIRMITAFTFQQQMIEDPDLCDLEQLRDTIIDFGKRLRGLADAFSGYPWTRFPRALAYNGHLAAMKAGEAKVYMALLALCDMRTLVTCASLDTIAKMAGRSSHTASKNLTGLKKRGLIKRWCTRHPNAQDKDHYLWYTRILPEACCETDEDKDRLLGTAAMPKTA